jgi:phenol/toluene 2-monooxygenase (NADH) P4/A4
VTVVALAPYDFPAKDVLANFARPLMYFGWDEHMMFCAPLAVPMDLSTRFDAVISGVLPQLYAEHPDFVRIDWQRVQWFRGATLFTPRLDATLAEQGFKHKSVLRFRTPGLEGIRGSCG